MTELDIDVKHCPFQSGEKIKYKEYSGIVSKCYLTSSKIMRPHWTVIAEMYRPFWATYWEFMPSELEKIE
jgi:hypothetical protein